MNGVESIKMAQEKVNQSKLNVISKSKSGIAKWKRGKRIAVISCSIAKIQWFDSDIYSIVKISSIWMTSQQIFFIHIFFC